MTLANGPSRWLQFNVMRIAVLTLLVSPCTISTAQSRSLGSVNSIAIDSELKTVKLYGAGGIAGLDAYQSGFFISEQGHILTAWSTVLDVDRITAVSSDGSRYDAEILGIDPNLEIAILSTGQAPSAYFDRQATVKAQVGDRVLALSNLFGIATGREMSSLQHGVIMAITELKARRGSIDAFYQGQVYVIDAMTNNPGAAGGALTNLRGQLLGMLGKELRDSGTNTWINYAIPMEVLNESITRILEGKSIVRRQESRQPADRPMQLGDLGIVLIPDVLAKTPAYIDLVQPNSIAEQAGLQSDDLILFLNSTRIPSQAALSEELKYIDQTEEIAIMIQRGTNLREVRLSK